MSKKQVPLIYLQLAKQSHSGVQNSSESYIWWPKLTSIFRFHWKLYLDQSRVFRETSPKNSKKKFTTCQIFFINFTEFYVLHLIFTGYPVVHLPQRWSSTTRGWRKQRKANRWYFILGFRLLEGWPRNFVRADFGS